MQDCDVPAMTGSRSGQLLFEISEAVDAERWVLIGGVHAHAIRAGIEPPRHTSDLDVVIDIGTLESPASPGLT